MAVKATVVIDYVQLYDDQTFNASFSMCDSGHFVTGLITNSRFGTTALSTDVNAAIRQVAIDYLINTWNVPVNGVVDSIQIVNPVNPASV